jgi:hypothetical protein
LVTDGRGDTTQKGRHLRTGLGETEDVVDEEKHCCRQLLAGFADIKAKQLTILALLVAKVLGNRHFQQRQLFLS